jgi:hypothetical protein
LGQAAVFRSPREPPDKREISRSNYSAVELGDLITADDWDEEGALRWLGEACVAEADLPALVKMEVENLLATRMPRRVVFARSLGHREFHRQTVPNTVFLERTVETGRAP